MVNAIIHLAGNAERAVAEAVTKLVSTDMLNGRYRIAMPIVMHTGSMVDVSVWPEPNGEFLVSDDGTAFFEIQNGGYSDRTFRSVAKARASAYDAIFDGHALLFIRVTAERLHGAILAMGSLIKEVVDETVMRSVRAKAEDAKNMLFERLDSAFDGAKVAHQVEVYGASTASYQVDALVRTDRGELAFDLSTKDAVSVAAAFTKLSDLFRVKDGPKPVGVTRNPDQVGPKLQLVASVAEVIRPDAAVEKYRRLAA